MAENAYFEAHTATTALKLTCAQQTWAWYATARHMCANATRRINTGTLRSHTVVINFFNISPRCFKIFLKIWIDSFIFI